MKRRLLACSLLVLAAACAGENSPTSTPSDPSLNAAAGTQRYIVVFKDEVVGAQATTDQMLAAVGARADYVYGTAIKGFAAPLSAQAVDQLRRDPRVAYIQADGVVTINFTQAPTPSWGLDRIDQNNLPLNNTYNYSNEGAGVHFYGIDTGILGTHNDFTGRMGNGFDAIGGGTTDCNGHGTHTASTAGGTTYGVAKKMTIHPVRVLNCGGSGSFAQVIAGIDWVTANRILPAVANMSLGGSVDAATNQAVANSIAAGVFYSVSAGNNFGNACNNSPASTPTATTVASSEINDAKSGFSDTGSCVDIFAPGGNITAAWIGSNSATNTISGTSMAAPHVAGAAALFLVANPGSTPAAINTALVNNATNGKITGSLLTGTPNKLLYMGFIGGGTPGVPPVASFTYSCNASLLCSFDGTGSSDDLGVVSYAWTLVGGGQVSSAATFNRQFSSTRTFDLTLTVTDAGGLTNSITKTIVVAGGSNQAPVASFTYSCGAGHLCSFNGSGSTDDVGVVSYSWRRPNGTILGSGVNFNYTFPAAGTFKIVLVVTDAGGLTGSQTQNVIVP
jgi:subtilisin family serine protease